MSRSFTQEELDRLLNQTIYSWDVSSLLRGVADFLEFSEGNLYWQRRRELKKAEEDAASLKFEPQDAYLLPQARAQIIEGAEYRFDFALSQSVRYAGLVAYVTCVEWCSRLFSARLSISLPKRPNGKNEAVHVFEHLNECVGQRFTSEIEEFKEVVTIRNCVVHSAGLVKGDKHEGELRRVLSTVPGFGISTEGFLGDSVHIKKGTVQALTHHALGWLPSLDEECTRNGTFQPHL